MQVVIPMAGRGSRFVEAGYTTPKPFLNVQGKTMIERVVENVCEDGDSLVLLVLAEHIPLLPKSLMHRPKTAIVPVAEVTQGAACTVLLAMPFLDAEKPLIIANSDQFACYDKGHFRANVTFGKGLILTVERDDPKYSYVLKNAAGMVVRVAEKQVISNMATVGYYGIRKAKLFSEAVACMMERQDTYKGEYYVAPAFNYMDEVRAVPAYEMYLLGTPEEYEKNAGVLPL